MTQNENDEFKEMRKYLGMDIYGAWIGWNNKFSMETSNVTGFYSIIVNDVLEEFYTIFDFTDKNDRLIVRNKFIDIMRDAVFDRFLIPE